MTKHTISQLKEICRQSSSNENWGTVRLIVNDVVTSVSFNPVTISESSVGQVSPISNPKEHKYRCSNEYKFDLWVCRRVLIQVE